MYIENKVSDSESKQYHFPDIYFQDITEIHNNKEFSVKRKYAGLYTVFINIIEEKTQNCRISFSGVFPRMTYICKIMIFRYRNISSQQIPAFIVTG